MYPRKAWLKTYSNHTFGFYQERGLYHSPLKMPAILVLSPTGEREILGSKRGLVKHKIVKDIKTIWAVMPSELGPFIIITRVNHLFRKLTQQGYILALRRFFAKTSSSLLVLHRWFLISQSMDIRLYNIWDLCPKTENIMNNLVLRNSSTPLRG